MEDMTHSIWKAIAVSVPSSGDRTCYQLSCLPVASGEVKGVTSCVEHNWQRRTF